MTLDTIITDLAALTSIPSDNHVHVMGYNIPADGGGGDFYWDSASLEDANGGTIFESPLIATGPMNPGRWLRYYSESVNVKWFGATGDGTTNDSPAFQSMIDFCERTGVKDVVIPFGYFYLEESVYVKIGGIKFTGQGSLLREDSWWNNMRTGSNILNPGPGFTIYDDYDYSDATAYKGSIIKVKNDISGIIYDESVCDSVYWRGIGFISEEGRKPGNTYAIDFKSKFRGPTWPFNIHECFFRGFNRVFNFSTEDNPYDIASINITYCAFSQNDEIVYQGFDENDNRYICWGFSFQHNKCHHNSRIIYGYFAKDLVTISDNNLEGTIPYSKLSSGDPDVYPAYTVDIEMDSCSVKFHGNHFEGMSSDCVSISSLKKDVSGNYKDTSLTSALFTNHYVDIYGNNFDGVSGQYKALSLTGCVVRINESTPVYVHACEILENGNSNVYLTDYAKANGTVIKYANRPWLSSNFIKDLYNYKILTNAHLDSFFEEQAYLNEDGEQWLRPKVNVFNFPNNYGFSNTDIKYCVAVYKFRNNSAQHTTFESTRYTSVGGAPDPSLQATYSPPYGESLMICIFPSKISTYGGLFKSAISFAESATESIEVCSSVFAYLTESENPEIMPVFESSNVVEENGTFVEGQTWYNGTNLRTATKSGTVGTLTGVSVSAASDNKVQLNDVTYIAQGQYLDFEVSSIKYTYKVIELRGNWATLDSTPSPSVNGASVTFHAPMFSDVITEETDPIYSADDPIIFKYRGSFEAVDANGLTEAGWYNNGAGGPTGSNFPVLGSGFFKVIPYPGSFNAVEQEHVVASPIQGYENRKFFRTSWNGIYQPWREYAFQDWVNDSAIQNQNASAQTANAWISGDFIANGQIGIGTSTPAQKLDVDGTIRQSAVTSAMLKANTSGDIVAAVAGTDYMAPTTLTSGTYTPTVTAIAAGSDVYTITTFTYTRIGNVVHVAGLIKIAPDLTYTNPLRIMNVSLPIASAINNEYDITGVGNSRNDTDQIIQGAIVGGDTINDEAEVTYEATDEVKLHLQFDYIVQ